MPSHRGSSKLHPLPPAALFPFDADDGGRGPSLLNFLDEMPLMDRKNNAPLMMPISEKYADMGTVVVGKVESGRVRKGDTLVLMPNKVRLQSCARSIAHEV